MNCVSVLMETAFNSVAGLTSRDNILANLQIQSAISTL